MCRSLLLPTFPVVLCSNLSSNSLTGPIPVGLSLLTNLTALQVSKLNFPFPCLSCQPGCSSMPPHVNVGRVIIPLVTLE